MAPKRVKEALGLNDLHVAVLKGNIGKVSQLLKGKFLKDHDSKMSDGTTPLMLATLMENMKMVKYLLGKKAPCKDEDVVKYTTPSPFLARKLDDLKRLGFQPRVRKGQKGSRRKIHGLLRNVEALRACYRQGDHYHSKTCLLREGSRLIFVRRIASLQVGIQDTQKVFGFICSTLSRRIRKVAISGWGHSRNKPDQKLHPLLLNNAEGSRLVRDFAKMSNFCLPGSENDNGNKPALLEHKGRWYSSHVEKQLSLWWIIQVLKKVLGTEDMRRAGELKTANVPENMRSAKIFLNHNPCGNCLAFLALIRRITGITIAIETILLLVRKERKAENTGCTKCTCKRCQRLFRQQAQLPKQKNKSKRPKTAEEEAQRLADLDELAREILNLPAVEPEDVLDDDSSETLPDENRVSSTPPLRGENPAQHNGVDNSMQVDGNSGTTKPHRGTERKKRGELRPTRGPRHWPVYHARHVGEYQRPLPLPLRAKVDQRSFYNYGQPSPGASPDEESGPPENSGVQMDMDMDTVLPSIEVPDEPGAEFGETVQHPGQASDGLVEQGQPETLFVNNDQLQRSSEQGDMEMEFSETSTESGESVSLREPVSNVNGRSGYFSTPRKNRRQLPRSSRHGHQRISQDSGSSPWQPPLQSFRSQAQSRPDQSPSNTNQTRQAGQKRKRKTIQEAQSVLDLKRFRYTNPKPGHTRTISASSSCLSDIPFRLKNKNRVSKPGHARSAPSSSSSDIPFRLKNRNRVNNKPGHHARSDSYSSSSWSETQHRLRSRNRVTKRGNKKTTRRMQKKQDEIRKKSVFAQAVRRHQLHHRNEQQIRVVTLYPTRPPTATGEDEEVDSLSSVSFITTPSHESSSLSSPESAVERRRTSSE
ncbi:hypothetical protein QBC46DRAFT_442003 [Diplogelasinospora grovesii]|uniref:Single-strand DNA deaminase toxin A-like C-terminal domain-containing protein n=1 Tax=Diplogelasinospora grovesii TaxID=303347 RepID=A0AAN6S8F2_9PEZI|nr:hypothetical protein QBC46DRAFT_442003 [Diplogelasinospora grovesii]